jgi:hypothetical protein
MNGSAIFLFSVLKMKVNMAVRRREAPATGHLPPTSGPLTPAERAALHPALTTLITALGLPPPAAQAALEVSTRRDHPHSATTLLQAFETLGQ